MGNQIYIRRLRQQKGLNMSLSLSVLYREGFQHTVSVYNNSTLIEHFTLATSTGLPANVLTTLPTLRACLTHAAPPMQPPMRCLMRQHAFWLAIAQPSDAV